MAMQEMTLGRALRYKKRVVEAVRKAEENILVENSIVKGGERYCDPQQQVELRRKWVEHLIALKLAIQLATRPIQEKIFQLAEAKAEIAFMQRIPTIHGKVSSRYRDETATEMEAVIRKPDVDAAVLVLQATIDRLQTEIDDFNAKTIISVPALTDGRPM